MTLKQFQRRAGKARMKAMTKEQRVALGRKAGLASAQKRKAKANAQHES
jgi:hypothetical protein